MLNATMVSTDEYDVLKREVGIVKFSFVNSTVARIKF
jgi:hypothetical protein